jgi:hypothetical protein
MFIETVPNRTSPPVVRGVKTPRFWTVSWHVRHPSGQEFRPANIPPMEIAA